MFIPLIIFLLAITYNTLTIVFLVTKHFVPEYVFYTLPLSQPVQNT